jgi:hypothetical protein
LDSSNEHNQLQQLDFIEMNKDLFLPRFVPVQMAHHGWSTGLVAISGLAYAFPNWRHLHLVVAVVCVSTISFYFLLPESLYWLDRNGRKQEVSRSIIIKATDVVQN